MGSLANDAGVGRGCFNRCCRPFISASIHGLAKWLLSQGADNYVLRSDTSLAAAAASDVHTMCEITVQVAAVRKLDDDRQKMFLLGNTLTVSGATAEFPSFNVVLDCPAKAFMFRLWLFWSEHSLIFTDISRLLHP